MCLVNNEYDEGVVNIKSGIETQLAPKNTQNHWVVFRIIRINVHFAKATMLADIIRTKSNPLSILDFIKQNSTNLCGIFFYTIP